MDNVLMTEAFSVQENSAVTKPAFSVRYKVIINTLKTLLFLIGVSALIINQARKDKILNVTGSPDPVIITSSQEAVFIPFNFLR